MALQAPQVALVVKKVKSLSRVRLLATPWIAAYQAPLPMGFSKQDYWSGVPLPSPYIVTSSLLMKERNVLKLRMAPGPHP